MMWVVMLLRGRLESFSLFFPSAYTLSPSHILALSISFSTSENKEKKEKKLREK